MRRLRHPSAKRVIAPFVDGELDGRAVDRLARHLDDCPDCTEEVLAEAVVTRMLARLANPPDDPAAGGREG